MPSQRITLILADETRQALRDLAEWYDCSFLEAVRRAVVSHRAALPRVVPLESRRRRVHLLNRLFELFERTDPVEEIRRLKSEDEGF